MSNQNKGLIGVQMSTLAPMRTPGFDVYRALAKLAGIGYRCVEVSQVPMTAENLAAFRRAAADFGMKVAANTASLEPLIPGMPGEYLADPEDYKKIVADCRALGCDMLRLAMMPVPGLLSLEGALDVAKKAEEMAEKLHEDGIDLYYHNHNFEFVKYGGKYLLDILRDSTRRLGFELDIHWIQRGGENPVAFIQKYAGRIRLLHLKDYRVVKVPLPAGRLDLGSRESMQKFFAGWGDITQFAEVGEGNLPIRECIEAGLGGGSQYFLIEQDETYGRDPYESLKISHDNLAAMGFAGWF